MKIPVLTILCLSLIAPAFCADEKAKRSTTPPPTKPPLQPTDVSTLPAGMDTQEIYLLMGQSNMKGRGTMPEDPLNDPQIIMMHLKTDGWFLARHPLHLTGSPETFQGADNAGVGPGLAFAQELAKAKPQTRIALIPCAQGGTPIQRWAAESRLFELTLRKAKLAMEQSPRGKTRIAGAIWLQGEAETQAEERMEVYPEKLNDLVDRLRTALEIPDLPFIACTIGEMRGTPNQARVNAILLDLPNQRPNTDCVDARSFQNHIGDNVHYDTATQDEIGKRFAAKMLKLQSGE